MQSACSTRQKFLLILFASVFSTLLLTTNSLPADFLCGNRELDDGEECDGEPCCQDCKFKPAGTVCRVNSWECDVPEYCTGAAAECPMDLTDMTKCLLHADSAATDADNVNPNMDTSDDSTYGGDSRFGYSPVTKERPLGIATSMSSSSPSTEFNPNPHPNHKYPKGTIFDFDNDVNGNNPEDIASLEFMCPVDDLNRVCSGNGKCIAENACLCYSGWVGTACSSIGDYSENIPILGSRRNATVFDEKEYFLGMIFLVFILVISLIGILATFSKAYITNQRNDFKRF